MNQHINAISGRLSLRPPQRSSLEILARICEIIPLRKDRNVATALDAVQAEFSTVTDFERGSRSEPFKNVIYSYPLSNAMADGFVKEPAVATRENFDAKNYDASGVERLKLEDGILIHEQTKVDLEVYARENGKHIVKPFVLVVARDTEHAAQLVKTIEDDAFFDGNYKGKVITVHSKQSGEEKDETVEQLITVESPENPTEIVVHVNMLKEKSYLNI